MKTILLVCASVVTAVAQQALPADIDPESYSRLPMIKRDQLSGEALRVYDAVMGKDADGNPRPKPAMGPAATSLYSPGVAGPMDLLNKYVRTIKPGVGMYHLCAILAAREYDDAYEWNSHAPAAVRTGISEATVDAVKLDRPATGLPEKEALVVRFGRAVLRDHKVSSELYAQVVKAFGQDGMFELSAAIGDYVMAAIMLRAVDQRVPTGTVDLPPIDRKAR
jgi:4-carboxymuconolactone decarboxylase